MVPEADVGPASEEAPSSVNTVLGVVGLDTWITLNPLIVLDELGCDTIREVGRHIVECARLELPDQHGDLEIRHRQAIGSEVLASMSRASENVGAPKGAIINS